MSFDIQQLKREWNYWVNPTDLQIDIARDKRRESPRLDELQAKYKKLRSVLDDIDKKIIELKSRGALDPGSELLPEFDTLENQYTVTHDLRCDIGIEIDDETMRLENRALAIEGGISFVQEFCEIGVAAPFEAFKAVVGTTILVASLPFFILDQTFQGNEANQK